MPVRPRSLVALLAVTAAIGGLAATASSPAVAAPEGRSFHRVATVPAYLNADDPQAEAVAEIATVTPDGRTVVYTDAAGDRIGFLDLADPHAPQPSGTVAVDGEPTSVQAVGEHLLVAVDTSESFTEPTGQLVVVETATREVVRIFELGGQPDSIALAKDGAHAAVAIENQRDEEVEEGALPQLPAGWLTIFDLAGGVDDWALRTVDLTGLEGAFEPSDPEPEYVTTNDRGQVAVTLQENNAVAVVDLETGEVVTSFSAGTVTVDAVDTVEDGQISLTDTLVDVAREPDAIGWLDDTHVATANEGDLVGGSRGWTIFDTTTGEVVWDAGSSFEHTGVRHGLYPEGRSDAKGTEPEGLVVATYDGVQHVFVGSERGNYVAAYDVSDPRAPVLVQVLPSTNGPEGLLPITERGLLVVSSEEDAPDDGVRATVQVFELADGAAAFPSLVSDDAATGNPIPWGALSGLTAVPGSDDLMLSITDSAYTPTRVLTIDTGSVPAQVVAERTVTEDGAAVGLDAEGIFARPDGGFWVATEGATGPENALVRLDDDGAVLERVALPDDVAAALGSNGLEGVTVTAGADGRELVWVALQRELSTDPAGIVRIGRYDVTDASWGWLGYPLEAPPSDDAWVGLSELVAIDATSLAVVERDNQVGPAATVKQVSWFDVPAELGDELVVVDKTLAADLLPALRADHGWTQEKVEGLTIDGTGTVWAVTDNDAVEDATGETLLWPVGPAAEVFAGAFDPTVTPTQTETATPSTTPPSTPPGTATPTVTGTLPGTGGGTTSDVALAGLGLLLAGAATVLVARRRLA